MALDPAVASLMEQSEAGHHQRAVALTEVIDRNAVQVGAIINLQATLEKTAVSDDSGLIAALQSAVGVPKQGAIVG